MSRKYVISLFTMILLLANSARGQGTIISEQFYSPSLGEDRDIRLYLPENYDPELLSGYPVVYFLHGAGASANDPQFNYVFGILDELIGQGAIRELILVMPDGSAPPWAGSMWANSELYGLFEDCVVYDVPEYVESTYNARTDPGGRAITGYSMGGIGCLTIAMAHPDRYCAVASNSGAPDFTGIPPYFFPVVLAEHGGVPPYEFTPFAGTFSYLIFTLCGAYSTNLDNPPYYVDFPMDSLGEPIPDVLDRWYEHSPTTLAAEVAPGNLGIYFNCGTNDELGFYPMNESFAAVLTDLGHTYTFETDDGSHFSYPEYEDRVRSALQFINPFFEDVVAVDNPGDEPDSTPGVLATALLGNAPNPFNPQTTVSFSLPRNGWADLIIYELTGRQVATLASRQFSAGEHMVTWTGRDSGGRAVPSGTYIVRLETEDRIESRKIMLVR